MMLRMMMMTTVMNTLMIMMMMTRQNLGEGGSSLWEDQANNPGFESVKSFQWRQHRNIEKHRKNQDKIGFHFLHKVGYTSFVLLG